MTPREAVLARVLGSPYYPSQAVIVLQGPTEAETTARVAKAVSLRSFGPIYYCGDAENTGRFAGQHLPGRYLPGKHTQEQAVEVVRYAHGKDWTSLILVASAYHQLRAFLTFLKAMQDAQVDRTWKLYNAPACSPMDDLDHELEKIETYRFQGHVCSYGEGLAYLQWRDAVRDHVQAG